MIADTSFKKSFRLLSASDFSRLKSNSKSLKSHTLIIYYQSNSVLNLNHSRLGVAVSKKVGKSHERNRIKRLIREHYRIHPTIKDWPFDFIVVVQKPRKYNEAAFEEFEAEFMNNLTFAFNKLGSEK